MISINAKKLENFASSLLGHGGFTAHEANVIAESLTLSELMGHSSHGIIRIKEYLSDLQKGCTVSGKTLNVKSETQTSLTGDAQLGPGQIILPQLITRMHAKIKTQAIVCAAVCNCGHMGRLGEWVELSAAEGYPSLLMVNDNGVVRCVAPPGGKDAVTSTNPIAFATPLSDHENFIVDMSTSAVALGKIKLARTNGTDVVQDCIQDASGRPTIDPNVLFGEPRGALLPMGGSQGYKGFALSMFIDMLVSGLSGGQTPPATPSTPYANNLTMVVWNPEYFSGAAHMREQAQKYIDFVRSSAPISYAKPVRIPGDRMKSLKKERETTGIPLQRAIVIDLLQLAESFHVPPPPELLGT